MIKDRGIIQRFREEVGREYLNCDLSVKNIEELFGDYKKCWIFTSPEISCILLYSILKTHICRKITVYEDKLYPVNSILLGYYDNNVPKPIINLIKPFPYFNRYLIPNDMMEALRLSSNDDRYNTGF
jgi:hypothetical protein